MSRALVFLLAGQSNMSGRGLASAVAPIKDARVLVSRSGRLHVAEEPLHRDPDAAVGPGMSFAKTLLEHGTAGRVILVPCAVGGTWIEQWVPGSDLFTFAVEETKAALTRGQLGGILWHQGEANAATLQSASSFPGLLGSVIDGLRTEIGGVETPFIAGEIGHFLSGYTGCPEYRRINRAIHAVCRSRTSCAVVSAEELGHTGDHLHFDSAAARELGRRYANAWLSL